MLATLMGVGQPLLLAPGEMPATLGERVGIAWNGRFDSARILDASRPFLKAARSVHLLTAETEQTSFDNTNKLADDLAWHGVVCERHQIPMKHGPVEANLLQKTHRNRLDPLVMGGYGHSRLQKSV